MSPLPEGYHHSAEESAPLFTMTSGYSNYVVGMIWGMLWSIFSDIELIFFQYLVVSFITGMLVYGAWLYFLFRRYCNPIQDPEIGMLVRNARLKVGFDTKIEIWFRDSPKLICMISSNPLFTAILLSQTAYNDIVKNPKDGEIILAYKIATIRSSNRMLPVLGSASSFFLGALFSGPSSIGSIIFDILSNFLTLVIFVSVLVVVFILCIISATSQTPVGNAFEKVEELYKTPPIVSSLRVFGGEDVPESKIEKWFSEGKKQSKEETDLAKHDIKIKSISAFIIASIVFGVILSFISNPLGSIVSFSITIVFSLIFGGFFAFIIYTIGNYRRMFSKRSSDDSTPDERLYHDSKTSMIESFLARHEKYSHLQVRFTRESDEKASLVVFGSDVMKPKNTVCYMPSKILEIIPETESLAPYIIYETQASKNENSQFRYGCLSMVPGFLFFFTALFGLFNPVFVLFFNPILNLFIGISIFILATAAAAVGTYYWNRWTLFNLDLELARQYTGYFDTLQKVLQSGYATPLNRISLQQRIEYLHTHLVHETP